MSRDKPTRSWLQITEELTVENYGPRFNELVEELNRACKTQSANRLPVWSQMKGGLMPHTFESATK
jgi:hypothetical protein